MLFTSSRLHFVPVQCEAIYYFTSIYTVFNVTNQISDQKRCSKAREIAQRVHVYNSNNTIFEGLMEDLLKCQISFLIIYRQNKNTNPFCILQGKAVTEDESKQIRSLNAQTLACCPYNQRTVLIVCSKYWQVRSHNKHHKQSRITVLTNLIRSSFTWWKSLFW